MRDLLQLLEETRQNAMSAYLAGHFYHGTARESFNQFRTDRPAYFCQDEASARDHATADSEHEGGTPYVLRCKLHVSNPVVLDCILMQDLHLRMHDEFVEGLIAKGHDCAVPDTGHDEIVVFGNSKIEIVEVVEIEG